MPTISNSRYLDMTSYGMRSDFGTSVEDAYHYAPSSVVPAYQTVNVALFLPRANDPTALLASDWGTRQSTLASLEASGKLWTTYGASAADWNAAVAQLNAIQGVKTIGDANGSDGYISSPESRAIWVSLDATGFANLFGVAPKQTGTSLDASGPYFWNGNLSLPAGLFEKVQGLWFDLFNRGPGPAVTNLSPGPPVTPQAGPQSIGNALSASQNPFPGAIAQSFYNFPLNDPTIATATIALIEPGSGNWVPAPDKNSFQSLLDTYRTAAGVPTPGRYYAVENNGTAGGPNPPAPDIVERSLDVGVVTSAAPGSTIGLYAGSGFDSPGANSNVLTAYQGAIWDKIHNPAVLSASYSTNPQTVPGSLFANAVNEIFVDAALRNITVVKADNDFGSSWGFANGLANQNQSASSPYAVVVGGTSITSYETAHLDETVVPLLAQATSHQLDTVWALTAGGLKVLPTSGMPTPQFNTFLEAAWNAYSVSGNKWSANRTSSTSLLGAGDGGVDTTQATPQYQGAYGLTPTSANPGAATGRGAPDVAADAGGNMFYRVPLADMSGLGNFEGTSAAAPMWASLIAQISAIFQDQGLPKLGYMNDLLYTASAIAPASFNDIRYGNNFSSFYDNTDSALVDAAGKHISLTHYGYQTGEDYDLVTGLGTPNGALLARALSAIATSQTDFASVLPILKPTGNGWTSGANQSVLVQATVPDGGLVHLADGLSSLSFSSGPSASYAWTSRFAQQSLQSDFDPNLVRLFDKQSHGGIGQAAMVAGESFALTVDGDPASAYRAPLTSPFGFVDYDTGNGVVRLARAVAVAETANGANDQLAILRVRQNGEDNLSVTFYRVDDLSGRIGGLAPGDNGYAAAAQAKAYQLTSGGTALDGPGYGNFTQAGLLHVNAGDIIAMRLTDNTKGNVFWAFSQANEKVDGQAVGHLWSYGLNTWGWEDTRGGGDRDYNDLVVGIDFTSAAGHGWLV